jgi:hypothetical protein
MLLRISVALSFLSCSCLDFLPEVAQIAEFGAILPLCMLSYGVVIVLFDCFPYGICLISLVFAALSQGQLDYVSLLVLVFVCVQFLFVFLVADVSFSLLSWLLTVSLLWVLVLQLCRLTLVLVVVTVFNLL